MPRLMVILGIYLCSVGRQGRKVSLACLWVDGSYPAPPKWNVAFHGHYGAEADGELPKHPVGVPRICSWQSCPIFISGVFLVNSQVLKICIPTEKATPSQKEGPLTVQQIDGLISIVPWT